LNNKISYKYFPENVKSFIEFYFSKLLSSDASFNEKLASLYVSIENRPLNYSSFVNMEFKPPNKIACYSNDIRWDGLIHDITHFFQYNQSMNEYMSIRESSRISLLDKFIGYKESEFEKEAFKAQEEFLKCNKEILSWKQQDWEKEGHIYNEYMQKEVKKWERKHPAVDEYLNWVWRHGFYPQNFLTFDTYKKAKNISIEDQDKIYTIVFENRFNSKGSSKKLSWQEPIDFAAPLSDYTGWIVQVFNKVDNVISLYGLIKDDSIENNIRKLEGWWYSSIEEVLQNIDHFPNMKIWFSQIEKIRLIRYMENQKQASSEDFNFYKDKNTEMYKSRLEYYKDDDGANIFWSSRSAQEKRFEALLDIGNLTDTEILDVGCGYGDLLSFINKNNIEIKKYTGVDIVPEIVKKARELHPNVNIEVRDIQKDVIEEESFDYVFGSGIFALEDKNWSNYTINMLKEMLKICRVGVAVNFLKGQGKNDTLMRLDPNLTLEFVKKHVIDNAVLKNNYLLDDFTIFLFKNKS